MAASVTSWFTNVSKQVTGMLTIPPDEGPLSDVPKAEAEVDADACDTQKPTPAEGVQCVQTGNDEAVSKGDTNGDGDTGDAEAKTEEGEQKDAGDKKATSIGRFEFDPEEAKRIAMDSAMTFGTSLFSFAKEASKTVSSLPQHVKSHIEEHTLLGDFDSEQQRFIEDKEREHQRSAASVAPWVGYHEEPIMKKQILSLSLDARNFLRDPPSGIQYQFDFCAVEPVALATLDEDPNLRNMRFQLVPKQIKEARFWRNYFYRVSLIKQSAQLSSMQQDANDVGAQTASTSADRQPPPDDAVSSPHQKRMPSETDTDEFLSDGAQANLTEEELAQVRQQLGIVVANRMDENTDPAAQDGGGNWEQEILADLNDYELVSQQTGKTDEEWEDEISQLLQGDDGDANTTADDVTATADDVIAEEAPAETKKPAAGEVKDAEQ